MNDDASATPALHIVCAPGAEPRALALSRSLRVPMTTAGAPRGSGVLELQVGVESLALRAAGARRGVSLDLVELRWRLAQGRRLALARAVGARAGLRVLDGMAGFGLDGLTLAVLGCEVDLVESHAVMAALLEDACARARPMMAERRGRAHVHHGDVTTVLAAGHWDVVYLDPMFPETARHALPKQRMQLLRAVAHGPPDDAGLAGIVEEARGRALERVVVKRRRRDPVLPGTVTDWDIRGRTVRFDVYRGTSHPSQRLRPS
jgi:16S rRNA (guanine1516-N2)-methyltransferase